MYATRRVNKTFAADRKKPKNKKKAEMICEVFISAFCSGGLFKPLFCCERRHAGSGAKADGADGGFPKGGRTEIDLLKCQGTEVQTGVKSKLYTSGLWVKN